MKQKRLLHGFVLLACVFLGACGVACCVLSQVAHLITPKEFTFKNMTVLKERIMKFAHAQSRLPKDLYELPNDNGIRDSLIDGWKRKIEYTVDSKGLVTLKSFGEDGLTGGPNTADDISRSFASRDEIGNWKPDDFPPWITDTAVVK